VEVGVDRYEATAVLTSSDERDRLYKTQAEQLPVFNQYEEAAKPRVIPVFRLVRRND